MFQICLYYVLRLILDVASVHIILLFDLFNIGFGLNFDEKWRKYFSSIDAIGKNWSGRCTCGANLLSERRCEMWIWLSYLIIWKHRKYSEMSIQCTKATSFIKIKFSIYFCCAHQIILFAIHIPENNCSCNLESTCIPIERRILRKKEYGALLSVSISPILSSSLFIPFSIFRITVYFYESLPEKPLVYLFVFELKSTHTYSPSVFEHNKTQCTYTFAERFSFSVPFHFGFLFISFCAMFIRLFVLFFLSSFFFLLKLILSFDNFSYFIFYFYFVF